MKFELTILGCGSALPTLRRSPTAQFLNIREHYFLIDCGEGTQLQLRKYKVKFQKINHIFISHLHGDHYLGLVGLLSSMHLLGRTAPLHIYAPKGLQEIIEVQLKYSETELRYAIVYMELEQGEMLIFEDEQLTVTTIPLQHRIACNGFLFKEKPKLRKMRKEKIVQYDLPHYAIPAIKEGEDYTDANGRVIANEELTLPPDKSYAYAYCSDTAYSPAIVPQVQGVDLLYHEATFLSELADRARSTMHSTAAEAATIALKAGAKQLLVGHYSARYHSLEGFLAEARDVFENTHLAEEGKVFRVY